MYIYVQLWDILKALKTYVVNQRLTMSDGILDVFAIFCQSLNSLYYFTQEIFVFMKAILAGLKWAGLFSQNVMSRYSMHQSGFIDQILLTVVSYVIFFFFLLFLSFSLCAVKHFGSTVCQVQYTWSWFDSLMSHWDMWSVY